MIRGGPWRSTCLPPSASAVLRHINQIMTNSVSRIDARTQLICYARRLHYNNALRQLIDGRVYQQDPMRDGGRVGGRG